MVDTNSNSLNNDSKQNSTVQPSARSKWNQLCSQYGDYDMPMEVAREWLIEWHGIVGDETLVNIMLEVKAEP